MTGPSNEAPGRAPSRRRRLDRASVLRGVLAAFAVAAIAFAPPDAQPGATRLAILALGIVAAWPLARRSAAVTRSTPERFETELRQPAAVATEIASLRAVDNTVRLGSASAFGLELRLKPLLRELARWRLLQNRGVDLDASPEAARRIMGEPLWRLTQAGHLERYGAPGVPIAELQTSVDQLERI